MAIDPSVQRKVQALGDEITKLHQSHEDQMAASSDQVKKQAEMLRAKKAQILDAEKKRNNAANGKANTNTSTASVSTHHDVGLSTGGVKEQFDASHLIEAMITEKAATGGFDYEKQVNDKLKSAGKAEKDSTTAGSSADAPDAKFNHGGKEHNLEVKQNSKAMFGQIELKHDGKKWDISERSKAKYPHTTEAIQATGFLHKVNKQWDKPTGDYDTDLQKGNVYHTHHDAEPIKAHYGKDRKTDYIQIGGGHGFYHTGNDAAKLGSPELEGKATLRARMKYRGTDKKTGKKKYGALIVMGLKDADKSHHDLDAPVQREWIEDTLKGHNIFESRNQADKYYDEAEEHKAQAKKHKVGTEEHHYHMANHYDAMHRYHADIGQHREADKAADKAEEHHELSLQNSKHGMAEAHKIGDKVEIIKGSDKGTVGHIGEIRHGAFKGAAKTFTVFHGEKGATQVKKEHIKGLKEETEYITEETECFSKAFWSGQQEEPKKNPYDEGSAEHAEYENGYMQGVMTRRRMQVEGLGHGREDDEGQGRGRNPRKDFFNDRPHTVHIDGKPWKKFSNGKQANAAANTLKLKGKKVNVIAHFKEETEIDEGLKHHVAAAAIAVAGALGGHAHAQSAPSHSDTAKPAATATAQDSDKSPHDGAPKADHKARIDKAESDGSMTRGDANVERMKHGLRPSFGRVRMQQEALEKLTVATHKHSHVLNKIKNGEWEAMTDVKPGSHVEVRNTSTGKRKMVNVLAEDGEGGAPVNNAGDGKVAGFAGDAGKKVKMTNEPLKRKPLPKFKTYVSQEHENA